MCFPCSPICHIQQKYIFFYFIYQQKKSGKLAFLYKIYKIAIYINDLRLPLKLKILPLLPPAQKNPHKSDFFRRVSYRIM